ncbi:glycosyltransferase family 4 protein [Mahella sp.]|uniref:glycosyltransferase family 4 protein n=1 Tax=Mahella sp. TaxID=2798721 RepID=UPI0025C3C818|nr:glycosyltransferase family 4 protein [Mahella sp.]MBZ4664890.1 glycosyl transferase group 1 [Mahella sp.]
MTKKVWIFNHYAGTPDIGDGTRHYDLAEQMAKNGCEVTIFASGFNHKKRIDILNKWELKRVARINGVDFIWLKTVHYKDNGIARALNMLSYAIMAFFAGLFRPSPDAIIASSVHPLAWLTGYALSRIKRARFIAEVRDLWPQTLIDMGAISENGMPARVLRGIERFVYKRADKIITLLPGAYSYIEGMGVDASKIVYIPNGVNIERYDKAYASGDVAEEVRHILAEHEGRFKAVYLGAHGEANGLEVIIDAAKILSDEGYKDIDILLVGDGPEKPKLIEHARKAGADNVYFYPPISKGQVPYLLKGIDLCLFTLKDNDVFKYGISPNKMFDYLCAAKPIVFACRAFNDIVAQAQAGISVPPEQPELLAQAIIKLYNISEQQRREMGFNGRRYAEEYHDMAKLADQLMAMLN